MSDEAARTGAEVRRAVEATHTNGKAAKKPAPEHIAADASHADALAAIGRLLALPSVELTATAAVVHGYGARASADIALSNGVVLTVDSVEEMKPATLARRVALECGARPSLGAPEMLALASYLRLAGQHVQTVTEDAMARDLGVDYLRRAVALNVSMSDTGQRWRAFRELEAWNPWTEARRKGTPLIDAQVVLWDDDTGARFARTGWLCAVARQHDPRTGNDAAILGRMARIGWTRRSRTGRVKATNPDGSGTLGWAFLIVEKGWEDDECED